MRGDGDGWSYGPDGVRHWGRFGAAGLLLRAPLPSGESAVLLQLRAPWSHQGGTWALPGGARDRKETPTRAAIREAWEEARIRRRDIRVRGERVTASVPSGWTYTTVIADAATTLKTRRNKESSALAWVPETEVTQRELHPGFAASWAALRASPARLVLDGQNNLGDPENPEPTADRDAAATARLIATLPRTLDLGADGFVWLHAVPDGPGRPARVGDVPDAGQGAVLSLTRSQLLS